MGRLLAAMGLVFMLLVAGGIGVAVLMFGAVLHSGQSAQAFVDASVPAITQHWDAAEFTARADPVLLQKTDAGRIKVLFAGFSALGPLQDYQGAALEATSLERTAGEGSVTLTRFVASAQYAHGDARIDLLVVRRGDACGYWGFM